MTPRVTISMPCFGRPLRTQRAVKSILSQTMTDWEAFIIGDGCPDFLAIVSSKALNDKRIVQGNFVHKGGYGYHITNAAIQTATGKYFVFMANDDYIEPGHMENYLSEIEDTDLDFAHFDCHYPKPKVFELGPYSIHKKIVAKSGYASIGHSSLIIRTKFLQGMPLHSPEYGHDWHLVQHMITAGAKHKKSSKPATYHVMTDSNNRVDPGFID